MIRIENSRRALIAAIGLGALALANTARAEELLMGNQPWSFQAQNRAGIAAMMVQKDNGTLGGSTTSSSSGGGNSCGGSAGNASATGNYTCIILNESTADISALQHENGDQGATSTTSATANGVPNDQLSNVLQSLTN